MRRNYWMPLSISVMMLLLVMTGGQVFAEEKNTDEVAIVNGESISRTDLDRAVDFAKQQAMQQGKPMDKTELAEAKKQSLDKLIGIQLLYEASEKAGNKVDEAEVNSRFEEFKKQFPNDQAFKGTLKQLKMTEDGMKAEIKKGLVTEKLIVKKFVEKAEPIPEEKVKAYYDSHPEFFKKPASVTASHILIKVKEDATEAEKAEALKKIKKVQERLNKGEDFAEVAKEASEGPTAARGGKLGKFTKGQMVPSFEEVAFSLEPGKISDIVETKYGYHIIEVQENNPETTVPFEAVKARIEQYLKQQEIQKQVEAYVKKLRKDAKIETFLKNPS